MSIEDRRKAARAEARGLDASTADEVVEGWEEDRSRTAGGMLERLDEDEVDPRCDCGREVDFVNQLCPPCHRQYLAELERDDD